MSSMADRRTIGILRNGLKSDTLAVSCSAVSEHVMMEEGHAYSSRISVFTFHVLFVYWVRFPRALMSV